MTTYQLITHNKAAIKLLTIIESDDYQSAVAKLRTWAETNGHKLATGPGDVEATCTFMQNTGWFDFDDGQCIQPTKPREKPMTTNQNFCKSDSIVVIEAMICGLQRHQSIANFQLNLDLEMTWEGDVCFGSVAILTLAELFRLDSIPPEFRSDASRANYFNSTQEELREFETAIVLFSKGSPIALAKYFGLPVTEVANLGWELENHNWQSELRKVIDFWETFSGKKFQLEDLSIHERWKKATEQKVAPL